MPRSLPLHRVPSPQAARAAGLRYTVSKDLDILREGPPDAFRYRKDGKAVKDRNTLERIRALAIPPAWTDVRICGAANGHLQATGYDVKGRKQYRYHPDWSAERSRSKFIHTLAFGEQLGSMRRKVEQHLTLPGLPAEKVLATVVAVMDKTQIRMGNDAYAKENGSFGLSTMKDRHVKKGAGGLRFVFKGKTGIAHDIRLGSSRLSRLVMRCRELPGQDLFQYLDEHGVPQPIDSGMVNDYIRSITGGDFTSKDIRTWKGTVHCAKALLGQAIVKTETARKQVINSALDQVAKQLGNTRTVCRKYYVHPEVLDAYGTDRLENAAKAIRAAGGLSPEERMVIRLLRSAMRKRPAHLAKAA
ncbi:MAG TPA: DNA topoisomerase IB [Flavobacteriales bacterium]